MRLGRPRVPLIVVGYSRGGRLAVELAAVMWRIGQKPAAVMSVYPSTLNPKLEEVVNFSHLPHSTRLLLVAADRDSPAGVRELLRRLERSRLPGAERPHRGRPFARFVPCRPLLGAPVGARGAPPAVGAARPRDRVCSLDGLGRQPDLSPGLEAALDVGRLAEAESWSCAAARLEE